ncbi:MAG: ABC transporter substrate-binding protein [Methanomicrobia archaeon]|nr:ABC transporter substrate-binding protein [Methanomicrobia archaeon]
MKIKGRRDWEFAIFIVMIALVALNVSIGCASAATTHYVIKVADGGPGTLRQAMLEASSGDTITFDPAIFLPASPATIRLASELPELSPGNITIDASSAGVILDGVDISSGSGLSIHSDHNVVKGLHILRFPWYGVQIIDGAYNTLSENSASNNSNGISLQSSSNNTITSNYVYNNGVGISLDSSSNNTITSNYVYNNSYGISLGSSSNCNTLYDNDLFNQITGIYFHSSNNNEIIANQVRYNGDGILIDASSNNTISGNTAYNNSYSAINLRLSSSNNTLYGNTFFNNTNGFLITLSNNNEVSANQVRYSWWGIYLYSSSNNTVYNNYFENTKNAWDNGTNLWNLTNSTGPNIIGGPYLGGNYWSDYAGSYTNGDGFGDTMLPYNSSGNIQNGGDWLPLVKPAAPIFDTGQGTYPSISGTHNGTITPSYDINVSKLYTYSCPGTGGHTEYVRIWNITGWNVTATWNGYTGDWCNLTFDEPFILSAGTTYNYTIITGSYPQIVHERTRETAHGWINCTEFVDANGKEHYDWIPAIRLEVEEIKIGIVAPLTGGMNITGTDMWRGAVLAAEEINAMGGVNVNGVPRRIRLVQGNTDSSAEGGIEAVTKLITEDKVNLLVGGYSSNVTYADSVVAVNYHVPFIITGASAPVVTRRTDIDTSYLFHHCPTTDDLPNSTLLFVDEIIKPAIYARCNFSVERPLRLAVLYQDSLYGQSVYDGINKTIAHHNLSMEVVAAEKFTVGETNYTAVLTTLKAAGPDVLYPTAFVTEQSQIVTQGRRDVGLNITYLSMENNDEPGYYTGVGSWGDYTIQESRFSPYAIPTGPIHTAVVNFREDYETRWGTAPGMVGASTYEGVYIAAEAIEHAGTVDKAAVREALAEIEMPQLIELMKEDVITFSPDYRESKFELYMQQLIWNETAGETRPKIVWPGSVNETDFVLPDWYEPGSP